MQGGEILSQEKAQFTVLARIFLEEYGKKVCHSYVVGFY